MRHHRPALAALVLTSLLLAACTDSSNKAEPSSPGSVTTSTTQPTATTALDLSHPTYADGTPAQPARAELTSLVGEPVLVARSLDEHSNPAAVCLAILTDSDLRDFVFQRADMGPAGVNVGYTRSDPADAGDVYWCDVIRRAAEWRWCGGGHALATDDTAIASGPSPRVGASCIQGDVQNPSGYALPFGASLSLVPPPGTAWVLVDQHDYWLAYTARSGEPLRVWTPTDTPQMIARADVVYVDDAFHELSRATLEGGSAG